MTASQLAGIEAAFDRYVCAFTENGKPLHPLLQLKVDHCRRVAREARDLSRSADWPQPDRRAAEALGLLHDVGRFPQFREFGTFADAASCDHGSRGRRVAAEAGWLDALPSPEREALLDGIGHHNRRLIPSDLAGGSLPLLRLIRDADKLDIYRIVLEALDRDGFRDLVDMLPDVDLGRSPSPHLAAEIRRHHTASLTSIRCLGDFLLMQLAWIYDFNHQPALQTIASRNIIARLLVHLDPGPEVEALTADIRSHLDHALA